MFVGVGEPGKPSSVRAYVFPLTGEFAEFSCLGGSLTRLRLTANAHYLVATDDVGCICVFDVKERASGLHKSAYLDLGVPEEVLLKKLAPSFLLFFGLTLTRIRTIDYGVCTCNRHSIRMRYSWHEQSWKIDQTSRWNCEPKLMS